jgi:hypothetical protein
LPLNSHAFTLDFADAVLAVAADLFGEGYEL